MSSVERVTTAPPMTPRTDLRAAALAAERPSPLQRVRGLWLASPSVLCLVAAAALLSAGLLWAMQDALIDDAYITLVYARTLAEHGQWGLVPDMPSNTATSPLNVVSLAGVTLVVRDPMVALWVVTIANAMLLAAGLARLGVHWRVGVRYAWIALPLLLLNPVLASSIGLETLMSVTLTVWAIDRGVMGSWRGFGWLAGVGAVVRPDLVVVLAVVWLLHPGLRRPVWWRAMAGTTWRAVVVGAPWYVFSWFYFGSAIPDTLTIKQGQVWGDYTTGLWDRYHHLYPLATIGAVTMAAVGLAVLVLLPLAARTSYRPVVLSVASAGLAGVAYFGAYSRLGVPPYFWYYALPIAGLTLVGAFALAALSRQPFRGSRLLPAIVAAGLAVAVASPALGSWVQGLRDDAPLREAPVHGNWALTFQYRQLGEDLASLVPAGATVRSAGEFGTILYYCDCRLVDRFDNRALVMRQLTQARDGSWLMGLNYARLDPADYPLPEQDYHLFYGPKHVDAPGAWNVWSPTKHGGHYLLRPGPRPADVSRGLVPG